MSNNPIVNNDIRGNYNEPKNKWQRIWNGLSGRGYLNNAYDHIQMLKGQGSFGGAEHNDGYVEIKQYIKNRDIDNSNEAIITPQYRTYIYYSNGELSAQTEEDIVPHILREVTEYSGGDAPSADFGPIVGLKHLKNIPKAISTVSKFHPVSLKMTLPSWKKVTVDMTEVLGGHTSTGKRYLQSVKDGGSKELFPETMTADQIERAVKSAYRNVTEKLATQGDRIKLRGVSDDGLTIEMWLNKKANLIETAYPK